MELIKWDCGENQKVLSEFEKTDNEIIELKQLVTQYDNLLDANQISELMHETGLNEIKEKLADVCIHDPASSSVRQRFEEYPGTLDFYPEYKSDKNKNIGDIGMLCPMCNRLTSNGHKPMIVDIDTCGTRMKLRTGKYGNFWGCTNYPNCKASVSTKERVTLHKSKLTAYRDWDDEDFDPYNDDIF